MSELAIRVEGLGKQYRLGGPQERYHTLRDQLAKLMSPRGLWRAMRGPERPTFWALKELGFEVKRGEVVGIIGRNGAGKSTLLKILSRITEPTEGWADIYGRVGSLLEVGTGFNPELTGRENIFLNGAILGMKRAEIIRKFDEIVAFAEVEQFIDTPVKRYSSGMHTRLAFGVAAHLEPEILIVDEVLAVGDAAFQKKCLGKMSDVAKGGRTVLFVSHNMGAVQRLCRRVILLDSGRLVRDGLAHEVIPLYTAPGTLGGGQRVWQRGEQGNHLSGVYLISASVRDSLGEPASVISITEPFTLEVTYFSDLAPVRPTAIINVFNDEGVCLFASNEFNCPHWDTKPTAAGNVRAVCRVPGNFMAEGTFYVEVAVGSYNPNLIYCLERDALTFQIIDESNGQGVRGPHVGDWPGVVRPMLDWSIYAT